MTTEQMALMIRSCSGIVCLCLPSDKARELVLPLMVEHNTSRYGTAFTISIEAAEGVTTGVSASDRIRTICAGDVLERDGHTEGSVDLVRLASLPPYAVRCELTNEDGTMARLPQIVEFAEQHDYPVVTIADIQAWQTTHNDKASPPSCNRARLIALSQALLFISYGRGTTLF